MECVLPPPKAVCSCTTGSPPWEVSRWTPVTSILQQPFGEVGAAEEFHRLLVFRFGRAGQHLGEVGGEFSLQITAAGHIGMGTDHLAPRF